MKRASKILSLLLVAIVALALLPGVAHADPPQDDPSHRHSWSVVSEKKATCTENGSKTWKCSACGKTYTEKTKAKGHRWDDGAVTTPATCTADGVLTYTCIRCKATKTEAIPMTGHTAVTVPARAATCEEAGLTEGSQCSVCGEWLTAQQTVPALGHDWDEGKVTTPPSGFTPGVRTYTCRHDPAHTRTEQIDPSPWLFAAITGNIPDFGAFEMATFDLTPLTITEQPAGGSITRYADETVHLTCAATGGVAPYTYEWYATGIKKGYSPRYYGEQTEPGFDADTAGFGYWCVVTDAVGATAATDRVQITYKIRIDQQPDNGNLQPTGTAALSCLAADGSGSYTYAWFNADTGAEVDVGSDVSLQTVGTYYCVATDDLTGETATSEYCEVYSTDPFTLVSITADQELLPQQTVQLVASFAGGVQDYEIWWDKDGAAIDSTEGKDAAGNVVSYVDTSETGVYTVHGVDSMYATAKGSVAVTAPKLTIVEQPVGGTIPKGENLELNVKVEGGEGPYSYTAYRNGEEYATGGTDTPQRFGFRVWYPGEYYMHIEDSQGRAADSDTVTFEDAVFRIVKQSNAGVLNTATDTFTLSVEVEGGQEPYTYEWMQYKGDTPWYTKASSAATCTARQPGKYACRITDAAGETIRTRDIPVLYTGQKPRITKQPSGLTLTPDEKGHFSFSLSCEAASGNGDESCLEYRWERHSPDGYWSYAGSEKTMSGSLLGEYRCKVIDVISREYTYTQTVTVAEKLAASVDYRDTIDNWSTHVAFEINITGGTAPYTVEIYLVYPAYHSDKGLVPSRTVLWAKNTVEGVTKYWNDIPRTCTYAYYEDGQWKSGWNTVASYAIITDAGGRTTRVDIKD